LPALIVSYTSHPGGAERILADHATAIGDDVIAACPEGWLADRLREKDVRVLRLKERPLELRGQRTAAALRLAAHGREVRELVEALRPHTVLAWGMRAALAYAALLPRFAEPNPRFVFQHNDFLPSLTVARAVRAAAARADHVLALSQAIATDLDPSESLGVEVIRPGVDLERFSPPANPPPGTAPALFLGAISAWKRPELAIKAAVRAGHRLILAGGPLDAAGEHLDTRLRAQADPGITFAGRLLDPADALRNAAVLLHTADREPYGMSLVEALASGVPVVAPAAGGPQEIVDDSCGRLYRPGDAEAAAAALGAALADRPALGRAARARAELHFDLHESRRRYAAVFALQEERASSAGIAIVTVLHDSGPEIRALMTSIERHLPDAHLIAVDSGSTDDGPQAVEEWSGTSTLIRLGENAGYGRGTNAGVAAVTEEVTIVLNPDVELLDDSLAKLAAEAARHPDRILAPLVMRPDGTRQDSVHPLPGSPPVIARAATPAPIGGAAIDPWRGNGSTRVGWAVGCALAARTETFRRLGPFDERAFMYAEDLDLCLRAADQRIETWFWPYARVLHHEAHSSATAFGGEPFELLAERRRSVLEERRGAGARNRDDLIQAATFAHRIALKTLLGKSAIRERSELRALLKSRRGRSGR
jgi:N-acetylglucosaminyl-diphospho-decaprenol L-rhamnosyltransferase